MSGISDQEKGSSGLDQKPIEQDLAVDVAQPDGHAGGWGAYFVSSAQRINMQFRNSTAHHRLQRIFTFATRVEVCLQIIAFVAAVASGAGIALQTLIFGDFVTTTTNFSSGTTSPAAFRKESSSLA